MSINKGYLVGGNQSSPFADYGKHNKEYNRITDAWTVKSEMPSSFLGSGSNYIGAGNVFDFGIISGCENNPLRYSPDTDVYISLNNSFKPKAVSGCGMFDKCYFLEHTSDAANNLEVYNPKTDSWLSKTGFSFANSGTYQRQITSFENKLYILNSRDAIYIGVEFYSYDKNTDVWTNLTNITVSPNEYWGRSAIRYWNSYLYATADNGEHIFKYDITNGTWSSIADKAILIVNFFKFSDGLYGISSGTMGSLINYKFNPLDLTFTQKTGLTYNAIYSGYFEEKEEFYDKMEESHSAEAIDKVELIKDNETIDLTAYYKGGMYIDSKKSENVTDLIVTDLILTFDNSSGYFNELKSNSTFYFDFYFNRKIVFSEGLRLDDGSVEYIKQATLYIKDIKLDQKSRTANIHVQDIGHKILKLNLNLFPEMQVAVANSANTGDGYISLIESMPFKTVNEEWTVEMSGTTVFLPSGSVSGLQTAGTVGTQYTCNQLRFTVTKGSVQFASGDKFTFTTRQNLEWTSKNTVKILYSALSGCDWDTGVKEPFYSGSAMLDYTKAITNTDLNYESFQEMVADCKLDLKGHIPYDTPAVEFCKELLEMIVGNIFIDNEGKLKISIYKENFNGIIQNFSDVKKIDDFNYAKNLDNILNQGVGRFKKTDTWHYSEDQRTDTEKLDGIYAKINNTSIEMHKQRQPLILEKYWYCSGDDYLVRDAIEKQIGRYAEPLFEIQFKTGLDALFLELGDFISVSESDSGFSEHVFEVVGLRKDFSSDYKNIIVYVKDLGGLFGYCASEVNEGDGIGWENASSQDFDTATSKQKLFAYAVSGDTLLDSGYVCK